VSESWDIRHESGSPSRGAHGGGKTRDNMAATLERIEAVVTA